ncbi:divalent metal cation transporter [Mesorhizobium sp.]|uniref:divalent metal cation transporter n=1 Tax=Mesorhizobium sp. TaxID=1871066 RepID=UPI0034444087
MDDAEPLRLRRGCVRGAHSLWGEALKGIVVPRLEWNGSFLTTLLAILGTTISPYLFF